LTAEGRVRVILQPKLEHRKLKGFDYAALSPPDKKNSWLRTDYNEV
jgi:hypothetical protein